MSYFKIFNICTQNIDCGYMLEPPRLKPGKAAGPDQLKPLLLKELRDEIAPITKIIFEKSLQTGKLPSDWVTANVMPVLKKETNPLRLNIDPFPSLAFSARF